MNLPRQLIVSVDTEEEGLWSGDFRVSGNTTENLRGLPRFQAECERLTVQPTYLIDAPVLDNAAAIDFLRSWQEAGFCEVGAHCHPWCNPPLPCTRPTRSDSYLCNLPARLQYQKLTWLTEEITKKLGRGPTSFRAGRYGFDHTTAAILAELGYRVDSSQLPMHDYRRHGGPDFRYSQRDIHFLTGQPATDGLIEIPVTAGFTQPGYRWRRKLWTIVRGEPWRRFRFGGIADRLGMAQRVKLTPEGTQLLDVCSLIDACVVDGLSTLVLMLHSSSLWAGSSPYCTSERELEVIYQRFGRIVEYACSKHGFVPITLAECGARFAKNGVASHAT